MTYMERICRGVKADIKFCLSGVDKLADLTFVGYLRDKTARDEFFINLHIYLQSAEKSAQKMYRIKNPPCHKDTRAKKRGTTSCRALLTKCPSVGAEKAASDAVSGETRLILLDSDSRLRVYSPICLTSLHLPDAL